MIFNHHIIMFRDYLEEFHNNNLIIYQKLNKKHRKIILF